MRSAHTPKEYCIFNATLKRGIHQKCQAGFQLKVSVEYVWAEIMGCKLKCNSSRRSVPRMDGTRTAWPTVSVLTRIQS